MAIVFADMLSDLQRNVGDSSATTFHTRCLNVAQRKVARARRWPELIDRKFFNTEAAYSTGTVAITVDTATVVLTGGVFPSTVASSTYRFALGNTDPWYGVSVRDSDTQVTLADNYIDATVTASSFIVYKSHYTLDATVDRIEEVWLHSSGNTVPLVNAVTDEQVTEFIHYPSGPGEPTHYYPMERDATTATTRQILLGPATPDDVYRVEYVFKKKTTDGTFSLDESRYECVMAYAEYLAYKPKHQERSAAALRRYHVELGTEWTDEGETTDKGFIMGDTRVRYPGEGYDYGRIIGDGTVRPDA